LNRETGDTLVNSSGVKTESLVFSMVGLFVLGLGAITVLMGVMKAVLNLNLGLILAFTLLSFLIMLLVEGVLIWLLLRRNRGAEDRGDSVLSKGQATKELDAAQTRALPEAMSSVAEHTTRSFEPIYSERKSK
jgi:heme/copper-type cytochrome/quinol oxidase subunit 2